MNLPRLLFVAAAVVTPVAALAQSSVTIWGKIDLSLDRVKAGSERTNSMEDNASRLGFRGIEDLGGGAKAHFGIESGFNADSGTSPTSATAPFYRNAYVGLQSPTWGAVSIGRTDSNNPAGTPIYSIITANISSVIHDSGAPAFGTPILNNRNRFNNTVVYKSPTFSGVTFRGRVALNGENSATVTREADVKNYDASLAYAGGGFGLGFGASKNTYAGADPANSFNNKWMLLGSYQFEWLKAYAAYGRDKYHTTVATRRDDVPYWMTGVSSEFWNGEFTFNIARRAVQADVNGDLNLVQFGYGYNLSKRTQVYALYDHRDPNDNVASNTIRSISAGISHTF